MNGRVYDPRLGRMLSPDPLTQAPENGQNYNRYTYANNNPLKYSDPSGFCFSGAGADSAACAEAAKFVIASAAAFVFDGMFGGNGCDKTCQYRHAALDWCRTQAVCFDAVQGVKEKRRRRAAVAILEATQAGLDWSIDNHRVIVEQPMPGANKELIEKAKNGEVIRGPDGTTILYGSEEVNRPTGRSRIDWDEIPEDRWTQLPILGGPKWISEAGFGIEIATQTGRQQSEYQVGVRYYQVEIVGGVIVSKSIKGVEWTDETRWIDDPIGEFTRRKRRVCIPNPGFEKGCTPAW